MIRYPFNDKWKFKNIDDIEFTSVVLPHDAQILRKRTPESFGGPSHGYFPEGIYIYQKIFYVPNDWHDKSIDIEFGAIYGETTILINGQQVYEHFYGYTPFTINLDNFLKFGEDNLIFIVVNNQHLPNSRWYTGCGIYRDVNLLLHNKDYIKNVKITTTSYNPPQILVESDVTDGQVFVQIVDMDYDFIMASGEGNSVSLQFSNIDLWSEDNPKLYLCRVKLVKDGQEIDQSEQEFGIRKVEWSGKGLFINGKETLLRGGCIHHDNGILGSAAWPKSEERKIRILKNAGFNAIRCAHNPCSKALLEACDKYGMYVIDEAFDGWYIRKTKYDYGRYFEKYWNEDLKAMLLRDYNHPSVIMYSLGNENSEAGDPKGPEILKEMIDFTHAIDKSRPITVSINLGIAYLHSIGRGLYKDCDTISNNQVIEHPDELVSATVQFNRKLEKFADSMNRYDNSKEINALLEPFTKHLDIIGCNYSNSRFTMVQKEVPEKIFVSSESFTYEIYKNWQYVKENRNLIGDFMWSAWDYLGESGIGAFSYLGEYSLLKPYPFFIAGSGVIDILGNPDYSCKYANVVWGKNVAPVIGVQPVKYSGYTPAKSPWRKTNAIESWAWRGLDGNVAYIEVASRGAKIELILNGKFMGRKNIVENRVAFKIPYESGVLMAISYDYAGNELGRAELISSTGDIKICVEPEEDQVEYNDIVYVPVNLKGQNDVVECNADTELNIKISGGTLLAFGSANPTSQELFSTKTCTTYFGRALAVVYASSMNDIVITVSGNGMEDATATVKVINKYRH